MEISAACLTSASISSGKNSERLASAIPVLIPYKMIKKHKEIICITNSLDGSGVLEVISDNLAELGEMPSVPFLQSHHVIIDFLVQIVQKGDGL